MSSGLDIDALDAGRTGREPDIGGIVLYLCSRAGTYINGQIISLDGGQYSIVGIINISSCLPGLLLKTPAAM